MAQFDRLIGSYFIFNKEPYKCLKYQIITGKLVIHTTTKTLSILQEQFEEKISFEGVTDKAKLRLTQMFLKEE